MCSLCLLRKLSVSTKWRKLSSVRLLNGYNTVLTKIPYATSAPDKSFARDPQVITKENMKQLMSKLKSDEREDLLSFLQEMKADEMKRRYSGQLAKVKWRSKFGRLSTHKSDPTGTFCEVPTDWLQKKLAEKLPPPTPRELFDVAIYNAMPFIGFGFLDNLIMIIAGDYIDYTIGAAFGISTMAAAALGNTVSDVAGIGSAYYVETIATKIGVVQPTLNQAQLDMTSATLATNLGRAFGVILGCLIGMFPLLFLPQKERAPSDEEEGEPPVT